LSAGRGLPVAKSAPPRAGLGDTYPRPHLKKKVILIFKIKITQKCDLQDQDQIIKIM